MFLGLHLDQSQGMFLCQPLLLAGVIALVPFVQQHSTTLRRPPGNPIRFDPRQAAA
jgi:hypothetical protein